MSVKFPKPASDLDVFNVTTENPRWSNVIVHTCEWLFVSSLSLLTRNNAESVDPAVFSNPFITTFLDATGLIVYFFIARAILGLG